MKQRILMQTPRVNKELKAFLVKFIEQTEQVEEFREVTAYWRFHVRPEQTGMIKNLLLEARDAHERTGSFSQPELIFLEHDPGAEVVNRLVTLRLNQVPLICEGCIDLEEEKVEAGILVNLAAKGVLDALANRAKEDPKDV